jgi:putative selenium metabolism protein SsnA
MSLLFVNALGVTLDPPRVIPCDLRVRDGRVAERAARLAPEPGDEMVDLAGRVLTPGFVCAHTHLYSSLARGMPPPTHAPRCFPEILERVWWPLDRALDAETVTWSARVGAIEAARCGVTTVVDHHASPNAIPGSLDLIRSALGEVGLRGVLCYETSDRDGIGVRDAGLAENLRFVESAQGDTRFRGLIGAHASFTLGEETLRRLGTACRSADTGIHVHVAEDASDERLTRERFGAGIVERFERHGLLEPRALLAHCVHLDPPSLERVRASGAWMIHNPRSNMNNGIGHAPLASFGDRAALGADGFTPDPFEELRAAWFKNQESPSRLDPARLPRMLQNGQCLIGELFDRRFGTLDPGGEADLVVLDYVPPTPMVDRNVAFHLLFGGRTAMVSDVLVAGRWVIRDGRMVTVDEREWMREAVPRAARLWSRM